MTLLMFLCNNYDRFTDNGPGEEWKDSESERVEVGGQTKKQFQFIFGSVQY